MSLFNINTGVVGLLLLIFGWSYWNSISVDPQKNPMTLPWVPIDVRKSKVYVSQTRDASMFTEKTRRIANIGGFSPTNYKDSMNGYLDASITSI